MLRMETAFFLSRCHRPVLWHQLPGRPQVLHHLLTQPRRLHRRFALSHLAPLLQQRADALVRHAIAEFVSLALPRSRKHATCCRTEERGSIHTHQHRSALNTRCWISLLSKEVSCSVSHTPSLPLPLSPSLRDGVVSVFQTLLLSSGFFASPTGLVQSGPI